MKRMVALLISLLMLFSTTVFANETLPLELFTQTTNFTAARSISVVLDDNSDIRALISEIVQTDNSMASVFGGDIWSLFTALFAYDGEAKIQMDMSADCKKIKLSLTNENVFSSVVSSNLNYKVNSKSGLWLDFDLTNEEAPKVDLIFLSPAADNYYYANVGSYLRQEHIDALNEYVNLLTNPDFKKGFNEILNLYAKVEKTSKGYKLSLDNDGFTQMLDAMGTYSAVSEGEVPADVSAFNGVSFLGKDGIQSSYTVEKGKITHSETTFDVSLSIKNIVESSEEEWPFESEGKINIKITEKVDYTKLGTTVVEFPKITESNSFCLNSIVEEELEPYDYSDYEYVPSYPWSYVRAYCETLPCIDGEYYVPLRQLLEYGYDDAVTIDYNNGVVTATSEYFPGFKTLTLTVGSDRLYTDGTEHFIGNVLPVYGTTYVNARLFTEVFGWELSSMEHDMLFENYYIGFDTDYIEYTE